MIDLLRPGFSSRQFVAKNVYAQTIVLVLLGMTVIPARAERFQPISPAELRMTTEPLAPGAPAIILYRQVDRDDTGLTAHEDDYIRVKILTEEGRKYADIEIPFFKENGNDIVNVHARTIRPDGSVASFAGKIFEKTIVKAQGLKYMAKTFTLPDVQVGGIIEYYYTLDLSENVLYDSCWILSGELFTKRARFSLKPYTLTADHYTISWSWQRLPAGTSQPTEGPDHIVRLEVSNVPAFQTEDYMPPEDELKSRVDFKYSDDFIEKDPFQYWKQKGKRLNGAMENFVGNPKNLAKIVGQIVAPGDSPEVKLRKIYSRVQQLRNTTFEVEKTEQEKRREKEKDASSAEDLWKQGYGNARDINWLFLALARAAGFEAYGVWASDRNGYFNPTMMQDKRLDTNLVVVKVAGKDVFCEPGLPFAPFGLLKWPETSVDGLRMDKDGGTWIQTPILESSLSRVERHADLTISADTGELQGRLTVKFTGQEALLRRLEERNEDDAGRKKLLEEQAREYIPAASEVELKNSPAWKSSNNALVAEYDLRIPGWVSTVGRRALFPLGLFSATEKFVFDHAERVHPIYFQYPFEELDDITVTLPPGWHVDSLPPEQNKDVKALAYTLRVENDKQTIHLTRVLRVDAMVLEKKYYATLRAFFQFVREGDEQQVVLQPGTSNASR